jgi:hypothetical protein
MSQTLFVKGNNASDFSAMLKYAEHLSLRGKDPNIQQGISGFEAVSGLAGVGSTDLPWGANQAGLINPPKG